MSHSKALLSKSRYVAGLQCRKRLWQQVHAPLPAEESGTTAAMEWGSYVGARARRLVPGGVLIDGKSLGKAGAIEATRAAMANKGVAAIYEATFEADGVQVRVDILERVRGGWVLNEVKSSAEVKDEHFDDVAIQLYVLTAAGVAVRKVKVWHIDTSYERGARLLWRRLLARVDVTKKARARIALVPGHLRDYRAVLRGGSAPAIVPDDHCHEPYACEFWGRCTAKKPADWIFHLPRLGKEKRALLAERGIERISRIPKDSPLLSYNQTIIADAHRSGRPHVSDRLGDALRATRGPVAYLDFETFSAPIPAYPGTQAYRIIPFQWSLHTRDARSRLSHAMTLADHCGDPRREFAESLIAEAKKSKGPIVVYSQYEKTILNGVKPALSRAGGREIDAIIYRLFDLLAVVRQHVYLPAFTFSFSLKNVAPALDPSITYDDLDGIADGGDASNAFARMALGLTTDAREIEKLRTALKAYCTRDTLALAKTHAALLRLANR